MAYSLYLTHHGIKGQQWGVRNGPPYPIEHKVMKAGTRLDTLVGYRNASEFDDLSKHPIFASMLSNEGGRHTYTYNPNDEWDRKVYRGPFAYYNAVQRGAQYLVNYQWETTKDLNMPTRKERVDEFKALYNDPKYKKAMGKELESYRKILVKNDIASSDKMKQQMKTLDCKKPKTKADYDAAYEVFNHAMENLDSNVSTKEYMKRMASKYDAMVDDNNQGIYNDAHDPVIIFKTHECLKQLGYDYVTVDELRKNLADVDAEMMKKYGRPALL